MPETDEILGQFLGDDSFPVPWDSEVERRLIGTSVATQQISTGDRPRVDGSAGSVRILDRASAGSPGQVHAPIGT